MRKTVYVCDCCKAESEQELAAIFFIPDQVDLCGDCAQRAYDLIRGMIEGDQVPVKEPVKEKQAVKKTTSYKFPDWGRAQALRDAGWSVKDVAAELGVSDKHVYANTKTPDKASKRVDPLEWANNAPDNETYLKGVTV